MADDGLDKYLRCVSPVSERITAGRFDRLTKRMGFVFSAGEIDYLNLILERSGATYEQKAHFAALQIAARIARAADCSVALEWEAKNPSDNHVKSFELSDRGVLWLYDTYSGGFGREALNRPGPEMLDYFYYPVGKKKVVSAYFTFFKMDLTSEYLDRGKA